MQRTEMDEFRGGKSTEENDIALAYAEYQSAAARYDRARANATARPMVPDPTVYLAKIQLHAAERVVAMVEQHYANIRANASTPDSAPSSPTDTEYFSSYESRPTTPVNQELQQSQDGRKSPVELSNPNFPGTIRTCQLDGGHPSTPIQVRVMLTPNRQGTQPQTPTQPALSQPQATPTAPRVVPTTPSRVNHGFNVNSPGTPNPNQRHYSVVAGRRTGVYSSWNLAKPMVHGLGELGSYQGFATLQDAAYDYFTARDKGHVKIVRLPGDTVDVFGPVDAAEDVEFAT